MACSAHQSAKSWTCSVRWVTASPIQMERCWLVGGGIGVPPMLNTARKAPKGAIACLGFRGADKAMLLDEFNACCRAGLSGQ